MEECGQWPQRTVTFLVPLELECHQDDGEIRQRLQDYNGNENNDENSYRPVDSTSEAGGQGSPTTTADAEGRSIPRGVSHAESTSLRTPGSSRESNSTIGTTKRCDITTEDNAGTPHTLPLPPSPTSSVTYQPSMSEGSERERGSQRLSQGSHDELLYFNVSSWRAYLTTIFFRPICLSSACIGIALGCREAYSLVHISFSFFFLFIPRSIFFFFSIMLC